MSHSLKQRFLQYIHRHHLVQKGNKTLLAVSGGADSMLLCELFYQSGLAFGIAHCNFQLREKNADEDADFVKQYAKEKEVPFHLIRFNTEEEAKNRKLSIEETARNLRYTWFEKIREEHGYHFIATAHHKNDNAETLLLNLFRGTGIHGLHGIPLKREKIIRPLLFLSKTEILNYFKTNNLSFKEDKTNKQSDYTRNFIRNEIIPLTESRFPHLIDNLNNNIQRFKESEILYNKALQNEINELIEQKEEEIHIPIRKLLKCTPLSTIAFELFKNYHFSYEQSKQIIALANSPSGKVINSPTYRLLKDRNWYIISPIESKHKQHILIAEEDKKVMAEDLKLLLSQKTRKDNFIPQNENIAILDYNKVDFPLILRRWKKGDYFYPLGMRKKKKLSRFFIDKKYTLNQKENKWILTSGQKIIWIVGTRIDDRFKITKHTKKILEITAIKK